MLYKLMIYDHTSMYGNNSVIIADSGVMKITPDKRYLIITLYDGYSYEDVSNQRKRNTSGNTYPFRRDIFKKQEIIKELVGFGLNRTDENLFRQNYQMLSLRQLKHNADSIQNMLNERATNLYNELIYSRILRYKPVYSPELLTRNIIHNRDTSRYKKNISANFDSALNSMSIYEQNSVLSDAAASASYSKDFISSTSRNVEEQARLINKHNIEWWKKFTLSVSCIIFFLIGAPLGAIIRKGGLGMPVVISVLFFVLWYILSLTSEKLVREGLVPGYAGMWAASVLLLIVGIFLTRKATLDSSFLNIDTYLNPIKAFFNKYMPRKRKVNMPR
jgi:lipopolysaccharide export system permease protein